MITIVWLRREDLCKGKKQVDRLLHGQTINYRGWLHSNEYRCNVLANNITAQVTMDEWKSRASLPPEGKATMTP